MSNVETYLSYLAGNYEGELPLPRPIRHEIYLATLCGIDHGQELPEPVTKADVYLKVLAENGAGGSGGGDSEDTFEINNAYYLFYHGNRVEDYEKYLPLIKNCVSTEGMFAYCEKVKELDLTELDTSSSTSMASMFASCSSMVSLKGISNWDTSKVTTMSYMFQHCSALKSVDFSGWDTSSCSNMMNFMPQSTKLKSIIGFSATNKAGISIRLPYGSSSTAVSALRQLTFRTDLAEGVYAIRSAINIKYCSFGREGMVEMFNTLPDVSGLGLTSSQTTITITGNPCVIDEFSLTAGTAYNSYPTYESLCDYASERYRGLDYQNAPVKHFPHGSSSNYAVEGVFSDITEEYASGGVYVLFLEDTVTVPDEVKLTESDKQIALDKGWLLTT